MFPCFSDLSLFHFFHLSSCSLACHPHDVATPLRVMESSSHAPPLPEPAGPPWCCGIVSVPLFLQVKKATVMYVFKPLWAFLNVTNLTLF